MKKIINIWQELTFSQKISTFFVISFLIIVSLTSILTFKKLGYKSRASEPLTPITPPNITIVPSNSSRVFVTSLEYTGNLGGLNGADTKCQERANIANLGGVWKAWLSASTPNGDARSRLNHSEYQYKLIDQTIIANNWVDLTDQLLLNPINLTETGQIINNVSNKWNVWTNTSTSGSIYDTQLNLTCSNWTSESSTITGRGGSTIEKDIRWTASEFAGHACNIPHRLYCFEQLPNITLTPTNIPTLTPSSTPRPPKPTCSPRPACLNRRPACNIKEPLGGWCKTKIIPVTPIQEIEIR